MNKQTLELECLSAFTKQEVAYLLIDYLRSKLDYVEEDFSLTQLALVGSWIKGNNRPDSDLDVAFAYDGRYREDSMCDALNMDPLYIDDLRIDFIPYSNHKGNEWETSSPMIQLPVEM